MRDALGEAEVNTFSLDIGSATTQGSALERVPADQGFVVLIP